MNDDSTFEDKHLTCSECSQTFVWTSGAQQFYLDKGLSEPKTCGRLCRESRRARRLGGASDRASLEGA